MNKIDTHCHLLPDVDDGPSSMAESLELASVLAQLGFTEVIATPHYIDDYSEKYRSHIYQQYKTLQAALEAEGIPLRVHLGGEIMLSFEVEKQASEGTLPVLSSQKHVLLEFPLQQEVLAFAAQVIFHLQIKGYQPIIAHPERVNFIKDDPDCLTRFFHSGVLLQINAGSLLGLYGRRAKKTAEYLLQRQMVHFVATDSHSADFARRLQQLTQLPYPWKQLLSDNPHSLLNNGIIRANKQEKVGLAKFFSFTNSLLGR